MGEIFQGCTEILLDIINNLTILCAKIWDDKKTIIRDDLIGKIKKYINMNKELSHCLDVK